MIIFVGRRFETRVRAHVERLPLTGRLILRIFDAIDAYRTRKRVLLAAFGVSLVMSLSLATTFYVISLGLPFHGPSWSEHLVIVPCASLVGAIPITPNGWGTTEWAMDKLYLLMPGGVNLVEGNGFLVSIGRRATDIIVALIGMGIYLAHRRKLRQVYAEAEKAAEMV